LSEQSKQRARSLASNAISSAKELCALIKTTPELKKKAPTVRFNGLVFVYTEDSANGCWHFVPFLPLCCFSVSPQVDGGECVTDAKAARNLRVPIFVIFSRSFHHPE